MNKYFGLFVCVAVFVSAANADLQCYNCRSTNFKDCTTETTVRTKQTCPRPADPKQTSVCIYKLTHDRTRNMDNVYAGCGQISANAPLSRDSAIECKIDNRDPNSPNLDITECRVCNKDLCNSAPISSKSLFTLLCLPFLYLFTKYALY